MSDKVKIFEQQLSKKCKFAILRGGIHSDKPFTFMSEQTLKYVGDTPHNQFVDMTLTDPWTRVIINDMSDLPFENFDAFLKRRERKEKLDNINEISK